MNPACPIRLDTYDNSWYQPGPFWKRSLWFFLGQPLFQLSWMPSSKLRVALLRVFGARVGTGVVIKPQVQIKYPWFLSIGDNCWIGEHCWIDNLTSVRLGSNVCLSQGAYLCTGNHNWSDPAFGLILAPIYCRDGSWAGAKSVLGPGAVLGECSVAGAGAVVTGIVPDYEVHAGNPARFVRARVIAHKTVPTDFEALQ